jgi:hypothetical protein
VSGKLLSLAIRFTGNFSLVALQAGGYSHPWTNAYVLSQLTIGILLIIALGNLGMEVCQKSDGTSTNISRAENRRSGFLRCICCRHELLLFG